MLVLLKHNGLKMYFFSWSPTVYLHVGQKLWLATQKFVQSNGHLGWILSVDWALIWALVTIYNFSTHNNPWDGKHSGKFRWWYFLGTCRYVKMKRSACHKQGTKKNSGSLTVGGGGALGPLSYKEFGKVKYCVVFSCAVPLLYHWIPVFRD